MHKAFVFACALLDFEIVWLWPKQMSSLCACEVSPSALESMLNSLSEPPAAVYITSPDYLGGMADVRALADICHAHGTLLAVDNAHGAYLRFLSPRLHPMDLGADICCDSAHKTLGVLTGGAYLHISKHAPSAMSSRAKQAMALFGSTSPSYLILTSLDLCNAQLAGDYPGRLADMAARMDALKHRMTENGWRTLPSDPMKLTIDACAAGTTGSALAQKLREHGIECEFADPETLVLMLTPENDDEDLARLETALGKNEACAREWPLESYT